MNDNNKRRKLFVRLIYVCIAVTLVSVFAAVFIPSVKSVMVTIAAVSCAGTAFLTYITFTEMEKRIESAESIVENSEGYAEIRYDKKNETAYITGDFSRITGIDAASMVLDETDYKKLIIDMISYPSDAGADIYMAARPEGWIKILSFENKNFEFTMIFDVSEMVSCKNIIKSLKYYDSETGLLCRDAFISKVRSVSGAQAGTVGLVTLLISGVDRLTSFKGTAAADRVVSKAAAFIKKFENPHNIFAGRTATNEFCVLITDTYDDGFRKYVEKLFDGLKDALSSADSGEYIRVYCGYALFDGEDNDAGSMMSAVDYAAFEAKSSSAAVPVEFDRANYVIRAYDFKKIQVFNKVVGENMVDYHFQPVVDAHTGVIFGYEALMRPREIDGIKLSPLEVVEIGEKQGMSSDIEYMTLSNTIRFLAENQEAFHDKKLFINAIPNCYISDEQYSELYNSYSGVFDKLIIEITEGIQVTEESVNVIRERYSGKGALIAMDDYGSGYANESTLIQIKPDFIKIDRSLIVGIGSDVRKQHLVANMIDFARNHEIKALGEGVETREELDTLISLGIDLIQGYYTGKPNAVLLSAVSAEVKDDIVAINLKNVGYAQKTFILDSSEPQDLTELAVKGYTDVIISTENAFLTGNAARSVNMRVSCEDGYNGVININNVNIFGLEAPVLTIGKNCAVTLNIEDENLFSFEGIRVPEGSSLKMIGKGSLGIDMNNNGGVIIGGSYLQDFGSITVDMEGSLDIKSQSDNMVAIGGGVGGENSLIELLGGNISAELKGIMLIGAGSVSGEVKIKLQSADVSIDAAGQNVVAIGSKSGRVDIECSSASVKASCSGDNCCGIGTLENGSGKLTSDGGKYDITIHSKNGVGIGAAGGNVDIDIKSGVYDIFCEGNNAVGIGDGFGSGNVIVEEGVFKMHIAASTERTIGSKNGKTVITGGNIVSDSRETIKAESPFGAPLEEVRTECGEKFSRDIVFDGERYSYSAAPAEGENFVSVYLPVGYKL